MAVLLVGSVLSGQLRGIWNVPTNLDFMTRLFLITVASWSWTFIRVVPELGYSFRLSGEVVKQAAINFALFAVIAIPLSLAIHFTGWNPRWPGVVQFLVNYIEIFLFIALLKELFFRGFLQNLLSRTLRSWVAGQALVSVLFGLFHILHAPFSELAICSARDSGRMVLRIRLSQQRELDGLITPARSRRHSLAHMVVRAVTLRRPQKLRAVLGTSPGNQRINDMGFDNFVEEVQVLGRDLVDKVRDLIHEGNVQRIVVKDEHGNTFMEIPVTVAAVGVILAPLLAAIGAISALVAKFTIVVVRSEPPRPPQDSPPTP